MITVCDKCSTKYQLNTSSLVKGSTAKFRCKNCDHLNTVTIQDGKSDGGDSGKLENKSGSNTTTEQTISAEEQHITKPKISGFSIKTKITFIIVTLIVCALSTVGFIASYKGSEALTGQAKDHLKLITSQKAKEYNSIFSRLQNEIDGIVIYATKTFARRNITTDLYFSILMPWNGQDYGSAEMTRTYSSEILALQRIGIALQGLVEKNPYLELGYMATENNVMVLDDEKIVGVIAAEDGYIPAKRPWYINAVSAGKTTWTQPYIDVNTKKLIVSCASPVFNSEKKVIGVVGFDVLLDTIQKDIISLDIGYDSQAFLLGKNGSLLAKPGMDSKNKAWNQTVTTDNVLKSDNQEFKEIAEKMIAGERGLGTHRENGNIIFVSYAPIPAIDASVGIVVSQKEVKKPAQDIQNIIMGVWVLVALISVVIGLMIGNGITKAINELTMRADLISQGKSDLKEITSTRKDEIGVLIEAFNRLVISLKIAMSRRKR